MKTFSVDDSLIEFLEKITLKYKYTDIQEAVKKSFIVMHLLDLVDEEQGEILIKNKEGSIVKFSLHQEEKKEIQEEVKPVGKIIR